MNYFSLLRQFRRKPLAILSELEINPTFTSLQYGKDEIELIIPHRDPFLLVDNLLGLDLTEGKETIFGSRFISEQDPVFAGHFPDYPIYPGTLQVEMAGQLGLCLTYFVINQKNFIPLNAERINVRATKVLGALFLEPVLPGVTVTLVSQKLEYDGYFGTVISQVLNGGKVCCVSISEVIFLDNS